MEINIDEQIKLISLVEEDSQTVFKLVDSQREYLGKWLPFVQYTQKVEDTKNWIKSTLNGYQERREYNFSIQKNNKLIGLIAFNSTNINLNQTEIGYWISENEQKQGIVTKSVKALCEFGFNELSFNKIIIKCGTDNLLSKSIPKRLGFQLDGIERDGEVLSDNNYRDLEIYTMLKREYIQRFFNHI